MATKTLNPLVAVSKTMAFVETDHGARVIKFNPHHDKGTGQFSSGGGGGGGGGNRPTMSRQELKAVHLSGAPKAPQGIQVLQSSPGHGETGTAYGTSWLKGGKEVSLHSVNRGSGSFHVVSAKIRGTGSLLHRSEHTDIANARQAVEKLFSQVF